MGRKSAEELGEEHGAILFRFLERIFGKTVLQIIIWAVILYIFRDFFIKLFTEIIN